MNFRKMKKVELHRHLEGSVRLETVLDVAAEAGVSLPSRDLPTLRRHALILEPMQDLTTVLGKFWLVQSVLATPAILTRVAYENCIDAYNDGIRVLELRYSPGFINTNHPQLTYESIHQAISEGVMKAEMELKGAIAVGLICIISRELGETDAQRTTEFALAHAKTFIGFDLAGDEVAVRGTRFKDYFKKAQAAGLGITVHSGEANDPLAGELVQESVDQLGATRIGHGIQIVNHPGTMAYIKAKNVVLEVCPTSNVRTNGAASIKAHPITKLIAAGIRVTLNSDDPHIFGIDLTHEYEVLNKDLGFDERKFERLNEEALRASFIEPSKKIASWNF